MSDTAHPTAPTPQGARPNTPRLNWRVVLLLTTLLALICASVIITDLVSPRDRNRDAGTSPAESARTVPTPGDTP